MSSPRIRIPTLRHLIGDATPSDFRRLHSPLSARRMSSDDFCAGVVCRRPDQLPIVLRSAACPLPRMTRCKVLSGKVRKK